MNKKNYLQKELISDFIPRRNIIFMGLMVLFLHGNVLSAKWNNRWIEPSLFNHIIEKEKETPEYILFENQQIKFEYNGEGVLEEFFFHHKAIVVNSNEAIEKNNKIYLPLSIDSKLEFSRARVYSPMGDSKELFQEDILLATNNETGYTYHYFALEGLKPGCIVEYLYKVKKEPNYTGTRIIIQESIPKYNFRFELRSPKNLYFKLKGYNGCEDIEDKLLENGRLIEFENQEIPSLIPEDFANYETHLMQFVYKLDSNLDKGSLDAISYKKAAQTVFATIYLLESDEAKKSIKKIIKKNNFSKIKDPGEQVSQIENFLKVNFKVYEGIRSYSSLEDILEKRVCDEKGMVKLMVHFLLQLGVKHEIVLTSNRKHQLFDPEFEAYNFLTNYLLYFPFLDKYLDPMSPLSRLGQIPTYLTHNYGLFISPNYIGNFLTGKGKIRFIEATSYAENYDNLSINVKFHKDFSTLGLNIDRVLSGYYVENTQALYSFIGEDKKKELSEVFVKGFADDGDIKKLLIANEGVENYGKKPFVVKAYVESSSFLERAGNKFLLKIGQLIGQQLEMYEDSTRELPVESDFRKTYHREISIDIPKGFVPKNLDALNMDVFHEANGIRTMSFTSNYKKSKDKIFVYIDEYYKQMIYPKEEFNSYRNVMNAAADFNKVVLLFEKE